METQRRVTFWYGREVEVRYLAGTPEVGDYVSHGNELWPVSRVGVDAVGTYVICEHPDKIVSVEPDSEDIGDLLSSERGGIQLVPIG